MTEFEKLLQEIGNLTVAERNILVIIDLNGLIYSRLWMRNPDCEKDEVKKLIPHSETIGAFHIWKRPHADDFINWLLDNYRVAVWSSATGTNVKLMTSHLFGKRENELLFKFDQANCVPSGVHKDGNRPIFTKPLNVVWTMYKTYGPENTILIDDSPEKTMDNPEHTVLNVQTWTIFGDGEPLADEGISKSGVVREELLKLCKLKRDKMDTVADVKEIKKV